MLTIFAPLALAAVGPTVPATECGPENGTGRWMRVGDYPAEARRKRQQGTVFFTLTVSAQGCPVKCTIIKSSGWPILDKHTCDLLLRRAKFTPKLDENGQAIPAEWSNKADWIL